MTPNLYEQQTILVMQLLLPLVTAEPVFALKGGTAINYFFREMPRYSVDIDLCYLPLYPRPVSLQEISNALCRIETAIYRRMADAECRKHTLPQSHTVFKLTVKRHTAIVKIEPNTVLRGSVFPAVKTALTKAAADHFRVSLSMATLSFPDLYGGKICAALDRQHPRDLFDVKLLLDDEGITDDIRTAFIIYLAVHNRPMHELLDPHMLDITTSYEHEFQGMTRRTVPLADLEETRRRLIRDIRSDLTDNEREFILSFKQGQPEWERIGIPHANTLPAVAWKLYNVGRMNPQKHAEALDKLKRVLDV